MSASPGRGRPARVRAAAALYGLGMAAAAEVVKQLDDEQVEELAAGFLAVEGMPPAGRRRLVEECLAALAAEESSDQRPREFAQALLGSETLARVNQGRAAAGAGELLGWIDDSSAAALTELLAAEPARIAAVALASIRPPVAGRVLAGLPEPHRGETMLALAQGIAPSPEAGLAIVRRVGELVGQRDATRRPGKCPVKMGVEPAVGILRGCDRATERSAMSFLEARAPELAEQISHALFSSISDLKWLDPRAIQTVLRQVERSDLAVALRGVPEEVRQLCLSNVSENMAADLQEEMEGLGPRPRSEVEAAQEKVLAFIRRMIEDGLIDLRTEEELV